MADNSNTVQITLQVKDDGSVVIDQMKGKIEGLGKSTSSSVPVFDKLKGSWLAIGAGAASVYATVRAVEEFINVAAEAEQIESRMAFQIQSMGYAFEEVKAYVDDFAESVLRTTRFSDEAARKGLGQMMQYTSSLEEGMNGLRLAMDMSTQTGQDLDSTTRLVGMAMNGNAEILGRWIPELRDLDEKLGSSATQAEKAAYAIEVLTKKFSGAAEKDLQTYAGQVAQLANRWDEVKEAIGRALLPLAQGTLSGIGRTLALFESTQKTPGEEAALEAAKKRAQELSDVNIRTRRVRL